MTKYEKYYNLSKESSEKLWNDRDYYLSFLRSAARLYKYNFQDQLLIHAQNPNATACAEFDFWSDESKMNRFVRKGSKGIALLDRSGERPVLRFVFDVEQTGRRDERSKDPYLWQVNENNRQSVIDVLGSTAAQLDTAILEKAHELAEDYADGYANILYGNAENTFLEDLDELNIRADFTEIFENSIAYAMLSRCGYDPDLYFDSEDFAKLYEFNSIAAISVIGTAVSEVTELALRSVERVIKAERSIENERNNITRNNNGERNSLQTGRENADLSPRTEPARGGRTADREIRQNAADVSERTSQSDLSSDVSGGNAVLTSAGNRADSTEAIGNNAPRNEESGRSDRGTESDRPDEVGGTYEQHSSTSGGDNPQRTDLQLNSSEKAVPKGAAFDVSESEEPEQIDIEPSEGDYDKPQQLSLFGDIEIDIPDTSDIVQPTMPTTQVTNDMIDCFLRTGSKEHNSLEHIVAEYQKNKSVHARADFLRKEFGTNGNGLNYVSPDGLQQAKIAVTHNNNGITIGIGDRARNDSSVSLSWEQAAERIGELLSKGEYCSQEVIDRAYSNEIKELSQKLWFLHQDVKVEYFIPDHFFSGGFDESTEK